MTLLLCAERECEHEAESTLYSRCFGCDEAFCDGHLFYCVDHENQHCGVCCENGTAPPKDVPFGASIQETTK